METLVVVPQHRNQYYSRNSSHVHDTFGSPSGSFRDINCRFQARGGILSTPSKYCDFSYMTEKTPSPKPQKPVSKQVSSYSEGEKNMKRNAKSNAIPITFKASNLEKSFSDDFSYSELWAGPAYSNSPPPSSLPIPKFSLRQKRSVSLELPVRELGIKIHPVAKSAPTSPRGGSCPSPNSFMRSTASAIKDIAATKDLRRILNIGDE
ncbi:hypothetical protein AQUCO_01700493v1 [Aquilegia coerulea]|uniref:Uncharacterized protein n=1 Tax=Aquilegia coerulea TaxID=218851 RepID=A0A2G5DN59_AQUCA|nr:hypothetical protein AQUCO_01700493v1 [Aquilegia coerulea]PIA44952.1 hypothetical protein AQUCO_01700493v1 [Aquilegia coerulea]